MQAATILTKLILAEENNEDDQQVKMEEESTARRMHCGEKNDINSSSSSTSSSSSFKAQFHHHHHRKSHNILNESAKSLLRTLVLLSFLCSASALLGSEAEEARLHNQLLLARQPASQLKSRLDTLLQLKQSISDLMEKDNQQSPINEQVTSYNNNNNNNDNNNNNNNNNEIVTTKRVFCNGFTGCGGRFRGHGFTQMMLEDMRKRMHKAASSKRVFCNSRGCFNGGKKRSVSLSTNNDQNDNINTNGLENMDAFSNSRFDLFGGGRSNGVHSSSFVNHASNNAASSSSSSSAESKEKRLFCNHFGGCRNMGKRNNNNMLLPILVGDSKQSSYEDYGSLGEQKQQPAYDDDIEVGGETQPEKEKRFFAASFDSNMDDFINSLKR